MFKFIKKYKDKKELERHDMRYVDDFIEEHINDEYVRYSMIMNQYKKIPRDGGNQNGM